MYIITLENFKANYDELEPLYKAFYSEMYDKDSSPFNMLVDEYSTANEEGWLLNFVVRLDNKAIGYCNMWLAQDLKNGDLIAQEDSIFIDKSHRNGIGKKLAQVVIENLRDRGVKRLIIAALDISNAAKLWQRIGFKQTAVMMQYTFKGN